MTKTVCLVHRHNSSNAFSRIDHKPDRLSRSEQTHNGLHRHVESRDCEIFEHDLHHPLSTSLGRLSCFQQMDRLLTWIHLQLGVVQMAPDFDCIIPVMDVPFSHWLAKCQNFPFLLCLVPDVNLFVLSAEFVSGPTQQAREVTLVGVLPSNTSLDHAGAHVDDDGL